MAVVFRNVTGSPSDPVMTWPYEGLVTVLEEGYVADWQPVVAEIRRSPWGAVARKVEQYCSYTEETALAALFTHIIARSRSRWEKAERETVAGRVQAAIEASGLTAAEFAQVIGTSASRLSTYVSGKVTPSAAMLVRIERVAEL